MKFFSQYILPSYFICGSVLFDIHGWQLDKIHLAAGQKEFKNNSKDRLIS
jgi:hypothetical protein